MSCYSNKLNQLVYENVRVITDLSTKRSVFKRYHSDKHFSEFSTYKMAAKINRGIKLRHCHPADFRSACPSSIQLVPRVDLNADRSVVTARRSKTRIRCSPANQKWFAPSCVGLSVRLSVRLRCRKLGYDTSGATRMQNIWPPRLDICHPYLPNQSNYNRHAIYKSLFTQKR